MSKAGRRSLQTHLPLPSTAVAHPPPPRPGWTPVHCSDPPSAPQQKPSRPRPQQDANMSWLFQKPPLSRLVPWFCVLTEAIALSLPITAATSPPGSSLACLHCSVLRPFLFWEWEGCAGWLACSRASRVKSSSFPKGADCSCHSSGPRPPIHQHST